MAMSSTDTPLSDHRIGIFIAEEGTEEVEFVEPAAAVREAEATVDVIGPSSGSAETVNNDLEEGDSYKVELTFDEADPEEYDGLIVPGGTVGADTLRMESAAVDLLEEHLARGKPAGVICHGPWLLVEAGVVEGRTLTSYPSLETDIENAGGEWVNEEVVVDEGLITSRNPDDLDAFCASLLEEFAPSR